MEEVADAVVDREEPQLRVESAEEEQGIHVVQHAPNAMASFEPGEQEEEEREQCVGAKEPPRRLADASPPDDEKRDEADPAGEELVDRSHSQPFRRYHSAVRRRPSVAGTAARHPVSRSRASGEHDHASARNSSSLSGDRTDVLPSVFLMMPFTPRATRAAQPGTRTSIRGGRACPVRTSLTARATSVTKASAVRISG